jgi:hypothetical protein
MDRWKYEEEKGNESNAGRGGLTQNKRTGTKRVMCGRGDILQVFKGQQHQKDEPYMIRMHGL